MDLITVNAQRCKRDGLCAAECPSGALGVDAEGAPVVVDAGLCNACGHCVAVCPHGALVNARVPADEVLPSVGSWPDPAAVDGLLRGRRSIRCYRDTPLTREQVGELLDVARYAPTASNAQEIRWIACTDPAKVRELAGLTAAWFATLANLRPAVANYLSMWQKGRDYFLRGAPALVVAYAADGAPFAAADTGIALTFFELAAVSRGLGTCWAGLLTMAAGHDAALRQALGLPEGHTVHGGLMLGYPKARFGSVPPRNALGLHWIGA